MGLWVSDTVQRLEAAAQVRYWGDLTHTLTTRMRGGWDPGADVCHNITLHESVFRLLSDHHVD